MQQIPNEKKRKPSGKPAWRFEPDPMKPDELEFAERAADASSGDMRETRTRARRGRLRLMPRYFRALEKPLQERILSGAAWSIAGAGLASGLTMVSNIASARILGASHYGKFAIVLSTTNLFTTLFTTGVGMTATKFVAEHRDANPKQAGAVIAVSWVTSIIVGAATALLICLLAPWLSRTVLGASDLIAALRLGGAATFFAALNGSQAGSLSGLESFHQIARGNLFRGAAIILLVTPGAALGGVNGALAGYVAAGAATTLFYQIAVRRECAARAIRILYQFQREDFRILSRFTLPALLAAFSFTPAAWWSNVILVDRSGYAEAGIFNAVLHWQMFILFFPNAASSIGLPILSNVLAERDGSKYKKCLAVSFLFTLVPAAVVAVPVAIAAPLIVRLYGLAFAHGAPALALISFAAVLSAANTPVGNAIWSLNATRPAVLLALLRGAALVTGAYLFAGKGATGLAGAYLVTGVIQTIATVPFMIRILQRRFSSPPVVSAVSI